MADGQYSTGDTIVIPYPFVRGTYLDLSCEDGFADKPTWTPGVRYEAVGPEDSGAVADAIGSCAFTVEAVFKPGRFPTRVFFTRQYTNPDGAKFGKTKLHIATLDKFRRLAKGYQHPFGIGEPLPGTGRYGAPSWEDFEAMLAVEVARINGLPASCGTRPKGGDAHAAPALPSDAVSEAQTPNLSRPIPDTLNAGGCE